MSAGLYKISGDVNDRNSEILSSLSVSGESFYWKYWDKAVRDCNIKFFKYDGEFDFENKDREDFIFFKAVYAKLHLKLILSEGE